MPRRPVTIEVDSNLVEAARSAAARAGVAEAGLYERALREVLVRDFAGLMDDIDEYQKTHGLTLTEDQAADLVVGELAAHRAERRNRD